MSILNLDIWGIKKEQKELSYKVPKSMILLAWSVVALFIFFSGCLNFKAKN